jgi:hypothetical protein
MQRMSGSQQELWVSSISVRSSLNSLILVGSKSFLLAAEPWQGDYPNASASGARGRWHCAMAKT